PRGRGGGGRVIVRRAGPADAQALTDLGDAVGSEPEGWLVTTNGWRNVHDERRYLRAIRRFPHAAVFVAEDEGLIVGRLSIARDQHPARRHVADLGPLGSAVSHQHDVSARATSGVRPWTCPAERSTVAECVRPTRARPEPELESRCEPCPPHQSGV